MQESYLPTKFPRGSSRSRGPVSAPTARLISCAGSGIWRLAESRLGKAAPAPVLQLHPAGGGGHALVWPFCCRREA